MTRTGTARRFYALLAALFVALVAYLGGCGAEAGPPSWLEQFNGEIVDIDGWNGRDQCWASLNNRADPTVHAAIACSDGYREQF